MSRYTPPFFSNRSFLEKELNYCISDHVETFHDETQLYTVRLEEQDDILQQEFDKENADIRNKLNSLIELSSQMTSDLENCPIGKSFVRAIKSFIKFCCSKEVALKQSLLDLKHSNGTDTTESSLDISTDSSHKRIDYLINTRIFGGQLSFVINAYLKGYKTYTCDKNDHKLLSYMYLQVQKYQFDIDAISGITKTIFSESFSTYATWLSRWIFLGQIEPGSEEFMIVPRENGNFEIGPTPIFLNSIKDIILECGISSKHTIERGDPINFMHPIISIHWEPEKILKKEIEYYSYFGKPAPTDDIWDDFLPIETIIHRCIIYPIITYHCKIKST